MDMQITAEQHGKLAAQYKAEMEVILGHKILKAANSDHDTFIADSQYLLKLASLVPLLFESFLKASLKKQAFENFTFKPKNKQTTSIIRGGLYLIHSLSALKLILGSPFLTHFDKCTRISVRYGSKKSVS